MKNKSIQTIAALLQAMHDERNELQKRYDFQRQENAQLQTDIRYLQRQLEAAQQENAELKKQLRTKNLIIKNYKNANDIN